jgi:uncharacterized protein (TIGR02145 family)
MKTKTQTFIFILFFASISYSQKIGFGVIDIDSNQYNTVIIGKQEWMSQNLNTSKFRNGDTIMEAKSEEEWINAAESGKPAWCYANNDVSNKEKYGKLYNWYAVNDPRGLSPEGWHIASEEEFIQMSKFLGNESTVGVSLKSDKGWGSYGYGTNSSGFSGLPGGQRNKNKFSLVGQLGNWWSSTKGSANHAISFGVGTFVDVLSSGESEMSTGESVRCVRN